MTKLKKQLRELFLTKQGWAGWILANIITSLPWIVPLIAGFLFKDTNLYVTAGLIWAFIISPVTPVWIINVILAVWIKNILIKKERSVTEQMTDQKGRTDQ